MGGGDLLPTLELGCLFPSPCLLLPLGLRSCLPLRRRLRGRLPLGLRRLRSRLPLGLCRSRALSRCRFLCKEYTCPECEMSECFKEKGGEGWPNDYGIKLCPVTHTRWAAASSALPRWVPPKKENPVPLAGAGDAERARVAGAGDAARTPASTTVNT